MSRVARVLLIDDDEEEFLIISDMLSDIRTPRYKLDWVTSYEEGLEAVSRGEHDVILLDYLLDERNGLDLLKEATDKDCKAPIIFLTAHGNYELDIRAMKAGAADFLVKGEFTAALFERTIRYSIDRKRAEEELKQHRLNLENLVRERTLQHAEARADAERRAMEAERRQAILEALLEHIPEGVVVVDSPDFKLQALSKYALELVGTSREGFEKIYHSPRKCPHADPGVGVSHLPVPIANAALQGQIISNEEHTLTTPDGERVDILLSAGPIRDSMGNITGAIAAWRDISELKRIQQELKRARDELEQRVYQRTLELAETMIELRESQKELQSLAAQLLRAQEEERKRIAREMHDSIGSSLSAVKFCLESAAKDAKENTPSPEVFLQLSKAMEQAIDESRRIMTDLRPSILDDLGILATIGWFCRRYGAIYTGISIERDIRIEEAQIPEHLKIIIFRIIQEAMNNSAKYSRAGKITLTLAQERDCIELSIKDDGIGFDPEAVSPKGGVAKFGLTSMRERAQLSGGMLEIQTAPSAGTKIRVCWNRLPFQMS